MQNPGITPTCVGTTGIETVFNGIVRDHPHVCGDYLVRPSTSSRIWGSPPRVWGLHGCGQRPCDLHGITPTCVGTTASFRSTDSDIRDHPHVCGDYIVSGLTTALNQGSPPRVWGLLSATGWS